MFPFDKSFHLNLKKQILFRIREKKSQWCCLDLHIKLNQRYPWKPVCIIKMWIYKTPCPQVYQEETMVSKSGWHCLSFSVGGPEAPISAAGSVPHTRRHLMRVHVFLHWQQGKTRSSPFPNSLYQSILSGPSRCCHLKQTKKAFEIICKSNC